MLSRQCCVMWRLDMPDPSSWIVWVRVYTWKWPFVQLGDLDRLGDCYLNEYGGTNLGIKSEAP